MVFIFRAYKLTFQMHALTACVRADRRLFKTLIAGNQACHLWRVVGLITNCKKFSGSLPSMVRISGCAGWAIGPLSCSIYWLRQSSPGKSIWSAARCSVGLWSRISRWVFCRVTRRFCLWSFACLEPRQLIFKSLDFLLLWILKWLLKALFIGFEPYPLSQ